MHSQRIWVVIGVLLVGATTPDVRACVCSSQVVNDREDAAQEFQAAAVVFEGEVVSVSMPTRSGGSGSGAGVSEITLRVIRSYKGSRADSIVLYDGAAETDCGFGATPGEKLFVYGFTGKDGKIYLQACGRSAGLEQAAADLRFARGEQPTREDLSPPGERLRLYSDPSLAKRGATLSGSVRRSDGGTVSGVFLTVWDVDEKGRREAHMAATQKVNSDGTFDVRYLAPRKYFVTAVDSQIGPDSRFVGEHGLVSLKEAQRLPGVAVLLKPEPLGVVKIRVEAPASLQDRCSILLRDTGMDAAVDASLYPYANSAPLDSSSVATFEAVPYGRYEVIVLPEGQTNLETLWTWDNVTIELKASHAEAILHMRKRNQ